jgi:hypothetical protein
MPFAKGKSGNPGGRPKAATDIQALARAMTAEAIAALGLALNDPKTRVAAAIAILDRGYGKPLQTVQSETTVRYVARVPEKAPSTDKWQQQHAPTLQ